MTALNKQALRQLAIMATPGPWEMEHENIWYSENGSTKHLAYFCQGDDVDDNQDDANTRYVAAADPTTVLALLDENLQLQRDKDSLEAAAIAMRDDMREAREKLESAEHRIAELEAREVVLPKRLSPEGYHIDEAYMVDDAEGEYLDRDEVIGAIRAAGIGVKGE